MARARGLHVAVAVLLLGSIGQAAHDVTSRDDIVVGVPNDGDWPSQERPALAIDDHVNTKYLHFKGDRVPDAGPTGFCVTPTVGPTVVTGMTFTAANDCSARDPIEFELYGSNESIDGPYTLIVWGEIFDFNQDWSWGRNRKDRNACHVLKQHGLSTLSGAVSSHSGPKRWVCEQHADR
jgi:hypothetical protein